MARVLVCDDEASLREMLRVLLRRAGYDVVVCDGVTSARAHLANDAPYDAVITDLMMPDGSGLDVLDATQKKDVATQVILITAYATMEAAVDAMRRGAYDYIQKPFKNTVLLATLEKALEKRAIVDDNRTLREAAKDHFQFADIVGKHPSMAKVFDLVARAASARASVLITGESGTGKEMIARALHTAGDRKDRPFIVINCGALPDTLMESELFGHEKGAFTGATGRKDGLFRAADGGTLFLDEIGELSLGLQVKLLRALQERRIRPVGGEKELEVDVRVVAATNRDVEKEVAAGRFRQDLYYRLNVLSIKLPPLRDRREDVPLLAEHFLHKHAALAGRRLSLSPEALQWLAQYDFPGNARELENIIERAVTLTAGPVVTRADLPESVVPKQDALTVAFPTDGVLLDEYLQRIEKDLLMQALERAGGNRTRAAKLVGMTFRSFRYRLAKFGVADADGLDSLDDEQSS